MSNEPNFEGEEMHIPEEFQEQFAIAKRQQRIRGLIILVLTTALVGICIGLFFWYHASVEPIVNTVPTRPTLETNKEPETKTATAQIESLQVLSTSDEITAIEADLLSTNMEGLDTDLQKINIELDKALSN